MGRYVSVVAFAVGLAVLGAGCGSTHRAAKGIGFRSTITRVEGTSTVVVTETATAATTEVGTFPRTNAKDVEYSGYIACQPVPRSMVRAANRSRGGRIALAQLVANALADTFPADEIRTAAVGCFRALREKGLKIPLPQPHTAHG